MRQGADIDLELTLRRHLAGEAIIQSVDAFDDEDFARAELHAAPLGFRHTRACFEGESRRGHLFAVQQLDELLVEQGQIDGLDGLEVVLVFFV